MILQSEIQPLRIHSRVQERKRILKPTFKAIILWHAVVFCSLFCKSKCCTESSSPNAYKLVDLSHEFNNETIYYPTVSSLFVNVTHRGYIESRKTWFQVENFLAGTHGGTHLDAPCHFVEGKWCVSDIPIERLVVPAVVIDISEHVKDDSNVHLAPEHLTTWESKHGRIPDGSVVLILTGWSRFWPDKLSYMGTTEKDVSKLKFPSIQPDAAQWLVDNRDIYGIGIDSLSIDIPNSPTPRCHQIFEEKNIYGLENVNNDLNLLPPTGSIAYVMPMKLKDTSGAPCRVVTSIPSSGSSFFCNIVYTLIAIIFVMLLCKSCNNI